MGLRRQDGLILRLLALEMAGSLRQWRLRHVLGIGLGGGALLAYGLADLLTWVNRHAALLRDNRLWCFGLPALALLLGLLAGAALIRTAGRRAEAEFLRVLPMSEAHRRRAAVIATLILGMPVAALAGIGAALLALAAGQPITPLLAGILGNLPALLGIVLGTRARLSGSGDGVRRPPRSIRLGVLALVDRPGSAWLGGWAWGMTGNRLRLRLAHFAWSLPTGLILALTMATSLHSHAAEPAVTMGLVAALLGFMLTLRYRPLGSPALRTLPIGFTSAWARLARLPLLLSLVLFALPSAAAVAAEPRAWALPLQQGGALVALEAVYAVFAVYFLNVPAVAALACVSTLGYAAYASLQYGNTVYVAVAALLGWLWFRARRRFRHG